MATRSATVQVAIHWGLGARSRFFFLLPRPGSSWPPGLEDSRSPSTTVSRPGPGSSCFFPDQVHQGQARSSISTRSTRPPVQVHQATSLLASSFFSRLSPIDGVVDGCRLYTPREDSRTPARAGQPRATLKPAALIGWPSHPSQPTHNPADLIGWPPDPSQPLPTERVEDRIGSYSAKSQPSVPKICVCCTTLNANFSKNIIVKILNFTKKVTHLCIVFSEKNDKYPTYIFHC